MERRFISYGRQQISRDDIKAVVDTLQSDYLTQGPKIEEFEQAICEYTGAKYAVAVSNGTAALHIGVASLKIPKKSRGITTPITFAATSNSMVYNGIEPIFVDIDSRTYNIDPKEIEKHLDKMTRIIIPVHFAGQPADMPAIFEIAKKNNLYIIEDAAHAIGSRYQNGKKVGSCCFSDMTIFSFHPVKTLTTGEGGVITTNDEELYKRLLLLRSHGITKDRSMLTRDEGPWYYEMHELGYNYRITDIQCALGLSQLKKIETFFHRRREIVAIYNAAFADISWLTVPYEMSGLQSCFHLYVLKIEYDKIRKDRTQVMGELYRQGIGTQVHYIPVTMQPYYRANFPNQNNALPIAYDYYSKALSIPLFPTMTDEEVEYVKNAVEKLYE